MHRDGQVGRQRPGRRGPDDGEGRTPAQRTVQRRRHRDERELHVDGRRALLLVLDLGLGQRRLAVHAPVHGLEALVDDAATDEAPELARDHRLVGGRHREVRVVPVTEHTQPPELLPLDVDVLAGELSAAAPLLDGVHGLAHVDRRRVEAELLVHLVLDGQAVAIPARHVDRVEAEHRARLHDHVLEDLVEDVAHVDAAVGVRWPVVQDPQRTVGRGLAQALVDAHLVPPGEHPRLGLGEVRLHRKVGFRQVQRGFVVHDEESSW